MGYVPEIKLDKRVLSISDENVSNPLIFSGLLFLFTQNNSQNKFIHKLKIKKMKNALSVQHIIFDIIHTLPTKEKFKFLKSSLEMHEKDESSRDYILTLMTLILLSERFRDEKDLTIDDLMSKVNSDIEQEALQMSQNINDIKEGKV